MHLMKAGSAPTLDLRKFPRLTTVATMESRDLEDLVQFQHSDGFWRHAGRQCLQTRQEHKFDLCNYHLRSMIIVLIRSKVWLTQLSLHSIGELMQHPSEINQGSNVAAVALPNLRHLSVTPCQYRAPMAPLYTFVRSRGVSLMHGWPLPASWLYTLFGLQIFELFERPREDLDLNLMEYSAFEFVRDIHWPSLRSVRVNKAEINAEDLRRFLLFTNKDRFECMEELIVKEPVIDEREWLDLRIELESRMLRPGKLELTEAYKSKKPNNDECALTEEAS